MEKTNTVSSAVLCNGCGECCRNFPFVQLTQDDVETLEAFTGLTAEEFSNKIDPAGEKRFMDFRENGDCIFLIMRDGAYSCSVYEARSMMCRIYPLTDEQKDYCRVKSGH